MDLAPFLRINPCGYAGMQMTQLSTLRPGVTVADVQPVLVKTFATLTGYNTIEQQMWCAENYL